MDEDALVLQSQGSLQDNGMDCEHRTGRLLIADLQVNTLGRNIYTKYIKFHLSYAAIQFMFFGGGIHLVLVWHATRSCMVLNIYI